MKKVIVACFMMLSTNTVLANEVICGSTSDARNYLTMRIQMMGLIPMRNEYKNKHLMKMTNQLIPYLNELCSSDKSQDEIISKMGNKCLDLASEYAGNEAKPYQDNCELNNALATAYAKGAAKVKNCESKNAVSDLSRDGKQIEKVLQEDLKKSQVIGR